MIKIQTKDADYNSLDAEQQGWIYNALDCCLTHEIWEVLQEKDIDYCKSSYDFVRAMQGPAMAMGLKGIQIDMNLRGELIRKLQQREAFFEERLDRMAFVCWGEGLNPRSPKKITEFLYDHMRLKVRYKWDSKTKQRKPSSDIAALEEIIHEDKYYARPICKHILTCRKLRKLIGVLETGIDEDNRMRTSYNVTGTETARWSSNTNCFGTGTNLQNITDELREIFIADDGWKFAYIDLEQAESRAVAYLSEDEAYIAACEGGDLHTDVARMIWPEIAWQMTDDPIADLVANKKVAGTKFYEHFSYRDLSKRGGHGTNYIGSAYQMAKHLHVSKKLIENFQADYFRAFPGIPRWHQRVATELQTTGKLVTPMGRTRYFLSRLTSDDTLKEGVAFLPQSTIGEMLNLGMYYLWRDMVLTGEIMLMAQIHDAVLIQYRDTSHEYQRDVLARAVKKLTLTIPINGRQMTIPAAIEGVGWNWRKYDKKINNIDSLMSVEQDEESNRTRTRSTHEATDFLARRIF